MAVGFIYIRIDINSQGMVALLYQLYTFIIIDRDVDNRRIRALLGGGYFEDSPSTCRVLRPHHDFYLAFQCRAIAAAMLSAAAHYKSGLARLSSAVRARFHLGKQLINKCLVNFRTKMTTDMMNEYMDGRSDGWKDEQMNGRMSLLAGWLAGWLSDGEATNEARKHVSLYHRQP